MTPHFVTFRNNILTLVIWFSIALGFSQGDKSTIKAQFALGVNSPSSSGFVQDFEAKSINFPTVNLGIQYMFKPSFGAKLDYGFNRISNDEKTAQDFKLNYSRINLQGVLDLSRTLYISNRVGTFLHAGPGFSFVTPLGNFPENKTSFFNAMAGLELHYGISDKLTLYLDTSYILGFAEDFDPISSGFGSFNGDVLTVTIGASISLSGCYYCEKK
tara:strand:+ start:391 stop:1035 length:645 start_codon:yes stop_codon:yes gene_type:complete